MKPGDRSPARWLIAGVLALAPVAVGATLATTPAVPRTGGVMWCCANLGSQCSSR